MKGVREPWFACWFVAATLSAQSPDPRPAAALEKKDPVDVLLTSERLDRKALFATVALGRDKAIVDRLLDAVAQAAKEGPERKRTERALRALRLIGPDIADRVVPVLVEHLSPEARYNDTALFEALTDLAPGFTNEAGLGIDIADLPFGHADRLPKGDLEAFRLWVVKLALWYRFHARLHYSDRLDTHQLIHGLGSEDALVREHSAVMLGRLGPEAEEALSALDQVVRNPEQPRMGRLPGGTITTNFHDAIREAAALAIYRMDPAHREARRGLEFLLRRGADPRERSRAALALGRLGNAASVPVLLETLDDDDAQLVREAVIALGMVGTASESVTAELERLTESEDKQLAACARAAMKSLKDR